MKSSLKTTFFNLLKLSNVTFFDDLKLVANMQKKKSGYIKYFFFLNVFNKYYENNRLYKALKYSIWKGNYGSSY